MSDSSDDRQGENTEGFIRYFFFWLVWVLVVYYCIRSLRFMAGRFGGGTSDDEDYEMTGNNTQDQEQAAATTMLRPNALYGNHHTTRQERRHLIQGALVNNSRAHGNDISRDNAENADHHAENDTGSFIDNTCIICLNDYDEDPDGYDEENPISGDDVDTCRIVQSKYCSHKFHTNCLVDWIEKKNECPCCRIPMLRNTDIEEARLATTATQ